MPSKNGDTPTHRSKREEESHRRKDRETDRDRTAPKKTYSMRRPGPEIRNSPKIPESPKLSRSSMTDLHSGIRSSTSTLPEMGRRVSLGDSKLSSYPAFSKQHSREAVRPVQEAAAAEIGNRSDNLDCRSPNSQQRAEPQLTPRHSSLRADTPKGSRKAYTANESDSSAKTAEPVRESARSHGQAGSSQRETAGRSQQDGRTPSRPVSERPSLSASKTNSRPDISGSYHNSPTKPQAGNATTTSPASPHTVPRRASDRPTLPTYTTPHPPNIAPVTQPPWRPPTTDVVSEGQQATDDIPRVDYLLQNGGLPHLIPRSLIPISKHPGVSAYQHYSPLQPSQITNVFDAGQVFSSVSRRIDDFGKVFAKNGSVAVATGYRSVARRLLDRLEHVFARNISSENCHCVMCGTTHRPDTPQEDDMGVSWGEILEFVSGRRELPPWPPFIFDAATGSIELTGSIEKPMQKLDPDVPQEYKQHYMRQNDKTKRTVQDWLAGQTVDSDISMEAPRGVDDETLAFAMLTRLGPEIRPLFSALMKGQSGPSSSIHPAGDKGEDSTLAKASLALHRLYRLNSAPRKPECTLYLLNNPQLHGMLATLAAVSPGEWDLLVSGRFDGFLWSGAEQQAPPTFSPTSRVSSPVAPFPASAARSTPLSAFRPPIFSPGPARTSTPFSTTTAAAAAAGGPVQHDEQTELAVLVELERSVYRDMELLEDAFEALHARAETLRGQLRGRAAGLQALAKAREPVSTSPERSEMGMDDASSLAPDDSASNVSFARRSRREAERRGEGGTAAERRRRR